MGLTVRWRRRARDERGAAAVEFGLLVPFLLLVVFGIIDFGLMLNKDAVIGNASRDGTRLASLGAGFSEIETSVRTQLTENGVAVGSGSGTTITICAQEALTACTTSANATSYAQRASSGANVAVTVSHEYRWITPVSGLAALVRSDSSLGSGLTLRQYTQMRVE